MNNPQVEPLAMLNVDCLGNVSSFSPELLGYKDARPPRQEQEAMHRRKVMRRARSKKQRPILLAELAGDVVGILRCVESLGSPLLDPARYTYISSVYVRPEARRRGVLRALVSEAERWSRARGLDQMRLHNVAGSVELARMLIWWPSSSRTLMRRTRPRPFLRFVADSTHASGTSCFPSHLPFCR